MFATNPLFKSVNTSYESISSNQATYTGTTLKTLILLGITGLTGIFTGIGLYTLENLSMLLILLVVAAIAEVICVIVGRVNHKRAMPCGIIYGICEGLLLGTITAVANIIYPGIAVLAIGATAMVFLVCLVMFSCGMMRNTSALIKIATILLISLLLSSILLFICNLFNIAGVSTLLDESRSLALLITGGFVLYGTIMLFLNFNEAAYYVESGATKEFEWVAAFGFLVSILYIYLEVLRFLLILMDKRK